jgi:alpha-L-rhamnosidase
MWLFAFIMAGMNNTAYECPVGLRCEFTENPLGVQSPAPLLSWRLDRPGGRQGAYQIVAAPGPEALEAEDYSLWNTGKLSGADCCGAAYGGSPLTSGLRVWWKVRIWDEEDRASPWSGAAFFEMGLLCKSDWHGRWMSFLGGMIGNGILLRRDFNLEKRPVHARAYVACMGYYEFRVNGAKIGDKLLDPAPSDYSKTVLYSVYDVSAALNRGLNVIGFMLGAGWAGLPKVLLQLNIRFEDGSGEEIVTDWGIGWMVARGPIVYNSIYDGEDYDARMEKDHWDSPEGREQYLREFQRPGGWILGTVVEDPGGELVGELMPPVRVTGRTPAVLLNTFSDGRELYDAGVNQSGWVRIRVSGGRGASVSLAFAEELTEDGELDTRALRSARCRDTYILRGDAGTEEYAPRFSYHGFRYVTLEKKGDVTVESLWAESVRSDLRQNAVFSCDNEFLNRLAAVMRHTDACNYFGMPTDCNQRDERFGWTTDTTSRIEASMYHFDLASFFDKWLRDVYDTQSEDGYFADSAPHRWGRRPCDPQVNTPALLPLLLYRFYGNRRALERCYGPLTRYIRALMIEADNFLISRTGFGEWACPKDECWPDEVGDGASSKNVSPAFVSTAYFFYSVSLTAETAEILGRRKEAEYYRSMASVIKRRFNDNFYNRETQSYDKNTQSANSLALSLGLAEEEYIPGVLRNIVNDLKERGNHVSTGNMGTRALIEVLCRHGLDDLAYEIMTVTTRPSLGYMLEQGATSLWERWEADSNNNVMNARNHPMFASCAVWFYKYLAGIGMEPDSAGFNRLLIAPHAPSQLRRVEAAMEIPAGTVRVSWTREAGLFTLRLRLPFNTTAKIALPLHAAPSPSAVTLNGETVAPEKTASAWSVRVPAGEYTVTLR